MNPTLQRAVTSFYNLVYEAQAFATSMSRLDAAEQEHYSGRIEGLNWVLDRCQELEDMDTNLTPSSLQRVLGDVKSDLDHELSVQRREKGRRADGREEALNFVSDYLGSLISVAEIESAKSSVSTDTPA
ncbi:MAG TPA: hypothetical protein VES96_03580 [Nitrospiraceae bacterium]|jgi:hypothetical protein|nr:hypothetical protein [Nitrospiraceae bacterium]